MCAGVFFVRCFNDGIKCVCFFFFSVWFCLESNRMNCRAKCDNTIQCVYCWFCCGFLFQFMFNILLLYVCVCRFCFFQKCCLENSIYYEIETNLTQCELCQRRKRGMDWPRLKIFIHVDVDLVWISAKILMREFTS